MKFVMVMAGLLVGGCAATGSPIDTKAIDSPKPSNHKRIALEFMRTSLFDPYSVRDARVSFPRWGGPVFTPGWVVCVEANAKNRMGAYTGRQTTALVIKNDRVINTGNEMFCGEGTTFEPFPELEQGGSARQS